MYVSVRLSRGPFAKLVLLIVVGLTQARIAMTAEEGGKTYGRACASVIDSVAETETPLTGDASPGPHRRVVVHLEANAPCDALVVAFVKADGRLVEGWLPAVVSLGEWEARTLPAKADPWKWMQPGGPWEVMVAWLPKGLPEAANVRELATRLREGKGDAATQRLQARKLRETLQRWASRDGALAAKPENAPASIAGAVRAAAGELPWRQYARSAGFSAEGAGVVIFSHAGR